MKSLEVELDIERPIQGREIKHAGPRGSDRLWHARRGAVRPSAVGAVMDADECQDATLICIGGRVVKVDASMDAVLRWLLAGASGHRGAIGSGSSGAGA